MQIKTSALAGVRVLIPLPQYGFDPAEAAVPFLYLKRAGVNVTFVTPNGELARADHIMLTGEGLGLLKSTLMTDENGRAAYAELERSREFQNPLSYSAVKSSDFDGLFLPGGHDKGMRDYLGSKILQGLVAEFFDADKFVGAICHGTLLAGRSLSPKTEKSVLFGRKTTGLTRNQELVAYGLTRAYMGDYYRTYPELMEDELRSYLKDPNDFSRGPGFPIPFKRDTPLKPQRGFVLRDGNYLSARWPGDVHRFGSEFAMLLSTKHL